ncbi:MAG: MFS transporter [Thermoplasmatota archaeon]
MSMIDNFKGFPRVFWIVQIFELMERGAYYTMVPIIAFHAWWNLGLPVEIAAIITIFMYPIQYGLPIFSGALAEKFGYRKQMILAYIILFGAYMFLSFAYNLPTLIMGVMLIGLGIGMYKPLISSTVAKATPQKDRNRAYATYYLIVNLAAAGFPIFFVILETLKVIQAEDYRYIFLIGSFFFLLNIFVAIFFFKEVPRSGAVKTVGDALRNIKTALSDRKFLVMVFLMGGFWAMYSTMLNVLPLTLMNFKFVPAWFTVMILAIPNPLTIILAGPFLIKVLDKLESLVAVMTGICLQAAGLIMIGFLGLNLPGIGWIFSIAGVVIASVGEFLVAPGYLAFVSKLAGKDRISAYVGANFISTSLGLFGGTLVFGSIYALIGPGLGRPKFFYGLLISIGLLLLVGFMIYYRNWGQEIIDRAKRIRIEEEGEDSGEQSTDNPLSWKLHGFFRNKGTTYLALGLIPVMVIGTFAFGTNIYYPPPPKEEVTVEVVWEEFSTEFLVNGNTNEGQITPVNFQFDGLPKNISVSLEWEDEAPNRPFLQVNNPDTFSIDLFMPNGTNSLQSDSGASPLNIDYRAPDEIENYEGLWRVDISCITAGDVEGRFFGLTGYADNGNDWSMVISVDYLQQMEPEE